MSEGAHSVETEVRNSGGFDKRRERVVLEQRHHATQGTAEPHWREVLICQSTSQYSGRAVIHGVGRSRVHR
eukprot:2466775-Rhodomonas_salina.1